jgi:hypothetical protein
MNYVQKTTKIYIGFHGLILVERFHDDDDMTESETRRGMVWCYKTFSVPGDSRPAVVGEGPDSTYSLRDVLRVLLRNWSLFPVVSLIESSPVPSVPDLGESRDAESTIEYIGPNATAVCPAVLLQSFVPR